MAAEAATADHAANAGAHGAEGAASFPPFDLSLFPHQLFWFALTFGALYLVLSRAVLPKVADVLARRDAKIKADLDTASRENDAAEAAKKAMERTEAESRASARTLIERMRAEAAEELAADQARLDRELSERAQAEEARIGQMRAKALAQIDTIAADVAEQIVERVAGSVASAPQNNPPQMVRA